MEFNQLPEDYDEAILGPQKRRTEFDSPEARVTCDAKGLIAKAKLKSERSKRPVDPITLAQREDDNLEALQAAIDKKRGAVDAVMAEATEPGTELSPEQLWLDEFQTRFNALSQLHEEIEWADVERSLKADPEAMRKLQVLDGKGHAMNVFGEEGNEFIFVSAWNNYEQVAADHRKVVFDIQAQGWLKDKRPGEKFNGNAINIAKALGVDLADPKFHEQLRRIIAINGWAWLKTNFPTIEAIRGALSGDDSGISRRDVRNREVNGSFRVDLRVKKA